MLDGWAGTLLVVSHDRYLLERVADRQVALLGDGRVRDLPGGVEEYLRLRTAGHGDRAATKPGASAGAAGATGAAGAAAATRTGGASAASTDAAGAARPTATPAEQREARKTMARVERALARLAEREERIHAAMLDAAADHARALELNTELREVVDERESLELEWLEAADVVS